MADSDYVDVEISLTAAGVTAPGVSIPLIPSYSATWPERTRTYSGIAGVAADFAVTTSPEYRAAQATFAQSPAPSKIMIGRCANKPTKILSLSAINPTTTPSHTYALNVRGQGITDVQVTFVSDASPTDAEWAAAAVTALNAVASKNYTAAGSASPVTITGSAPGAWFDIQVVDPNVMKIAETTADAGIAADLTAILNESKAWYALGNYFNSAAIVDAIAVWVESNKLLFIAQSQDTSTILTATGNGDAIDTLKTGNYMRSAGIWHPFPSEFVDFAWMGAMLPKMVRGLGKWATWAIKPLAAVTANVLTETQRTNVCGINGTGGRNATVFELVFGVPRTSNTAQVGNGNFIDSTIGLDAIRIDVTTSVFDLLDQNDQVPFTDPGITGIQSKIKAALKRGESDQILVANTSSVTVPPAPVPPPANRILTGVTFTGTRAGAVQGAQINGFLS